MEKKGRLYHLFRRWANLKHPTSIFYRYVEKKVPVYKLPDPLTLEMGETVETPEDWFDKRRLELLNMFESEVYGKAPSLPKATPYQLIEEDMGALGGLATRKQIKITLAGEKGKISVLFLLYIPNEPKTPVPLFYGLNFYGNQTINPDPKIILSKAWVRNNRSFGITDNEATEESRGVRKERWCVESVVKNGYAIGTAFYGDITPDKPDSLHEGIHSEFFKEQQKERGQHDWGAIGAWAFGLRRIMDYLETGAETRINLNRVGLIGHSRLGKTALWAAAQDQRFSLVCASGSGCGGVALSKRCFGETVERINNQFPHWFAKQFRTYNGKEHLLPLDQHMLIALIAPRPIYIASASRDTWADPLGGYRALQAADPVYKFFGTDGFNAPPEPLIETPIYSTIGHHLRDGGHDLTPYEWQNFLKFAELHAKKK